MTCTEYIGTNPTTELELYVLELPSVETLPSALNTAGKFATILIAWDANDVSTDTISSFARRLIDAGGVCFCTWGENCELVHDIIDEELVGDGLALDNKPHVMTSWHDGDSLADAIWFSLYTATPNQAYVNDHRSVVAISIGCRDWAREIRAAFINTERFTDQILKMND